MHQLLGVDRLMHYRHFNCTYHCVRQPTFISRKTEYLNALSILEVKGIFILSLKWILRRTAQV